jgi:AcrR family transcriptional regulator
MTIKNKIIDVTYRKFSEKGYSATLREIAKASGLKKQSLYNYFDSKEALFFEMINFEVENHFKDRLVDLKALDTLETTEQLKKIFMSIIDSYKDLEKLKFWKRLLLIEKKSLLVETKKIIKANEYIFTKQLRSILLEILSKKPELSQYYDRILLTYMSLIHGVLDGYLLYGDEEYFDEYINEVWLFYWQGLQCYLKGDIIENK